MLIFKQPWATCEKMPMMVTKKERRRRRRKKKDDKKTKIMNMIMVIRRKKGRKEERKKIAFNTFYLQFHGVRHMVTDHRYYERGNPLPPLHGLIFPIILYAPSHRHYNTNHGLCNTSCGALAGTNNRLMGPQGEIDPMSHRITPLPDDIKGRQRPCL